MIITVYKFKTMPTIRRMSHSALSYRQKADCRTADKIYTSK